MTDMETVSVKFSLTPKDWILLSKKYAPEIFSEASATWFDNANKENMTECLINAFMNEIVLRVLEDHIKK